MRNLHVVSIVPFLVGFSFFDKSNKLLNNENCVLGQMPVIIKNGNLMPKNLQTVVLAEIKKIDSNSVRFAFSSGDDRTPVVLTVSEKAGLVHGLLGASDRHFLSCKS